MNFKRGFTVVEVMLVVTIISVLSVVTISFVSLSRDRAKDAKVQQEKVLVKGVIEAYAAEHGGYPNPSRGQGAALYCVGGTECAINSHSISSYIDPTTGNTVDNGEGFQLSDLISFTGEDGLSQGFVYVSCGTDEPTCEDNGLIYSLSDGEYISYFDGTDEKLEGDDDYINIGIDLDKYPRIGGGDNPDPNAYTSTCRESDYPSNFGAFALFGYCQESQSTAGKWYCSQDCSQIVTNNPVCDPAIHYVDNCQYGETLNGYEPYCSGSCRLYSEEFPVQCIGGPGDQSQCYNDGGHWSCKDSQYCAMVCDPSDPCGDMDGDGIQNQDELPGCQNNPLSSCGNDEDEDLVLNDNDNCPQISNPGQENFDQYLPGGDAWGDACDNDDDADGVDGSVDSNDLDPNVQ